MWYSKEYVAIQVGSIDGTHTEPHDAAITRANHSTYKPPRNLNTDPNATLFIGRLNLDTTEQTIKPFFEKYGEILHTELIRNNVTGLSQGYAFITFKEIHAAREAYKDANKATLDGHVILLDYERSRAMKGWIPRRLGGGYGGRKESGQLRFGARERPFRQGKLHVDSDQRRSDTWKYSSSKRRRSRSPSREERRRSRSRERHHSTSSSHTTIRISSSRDIKRHRSRSKERDSISRMHESDNHKRKRDDNYQGDDRHSKSSRREEHSSYRRR